jgi:hypothetical protein
MVGEVLGLAPAHSASETFKPSIGPRPCKPLPFSSGLLHSASVILVDFMYDREGFQGELD